MKNNRKLDNPVFLSLMFLFACGFLFSTFGLTSVNAEEGEDPKDGDGDSGGFIIETEKVEGDMDLLGALQGKVDIKEGQITGLTITKKLETGEDQAPLVIKITSPGPIPVQNLKAETIGGEPVIPGGFCASEHLGWLCISDVTMTVSEQTAQSITLPDAKVETCFESECDSMPDEDSISEEKRQSMMKQMEEQELSLQEMKDGLKDDKKQLKSIKELLDQAAETYEKIKEDGQPEKLEETIKELTELFEEEADLDESKPENVDLDEEEMMEQLVSLTKQSGDDYTTSLESTAKFVKTLSKASEKMKELQESIKLKEDSLAKIIEEEKKQAADKDHKQAKDYKALKEKAEESETSKQGDKADIDTEGKSESKADDSNKEKAADEEININDLQKDLKVIREKMQTQKERLDDMLEKEKTLTKQLDQITEDLTNIKMTIMVTKEAYPKETFDKLMEHLDVVELSKEDKEKMEEVKKKQEKQNNQVDENSKKGKKDSKDQQVDKNEKDKAASDSQDDKTDPAVEEKSSEKNANTQKDTKKDDNGGILNDVTDAVEELLPNSS
ncbi:hypothetical protein WMZ97_04920 [Lentibacillus sp. N15]|uniref:coiled-coil domain-containing protein n=1 Tax=Lentibacillus songyuanensis TaxID=3136161 RepID=UPI0031BA5C88